MSKDTHVSQFKRDWEEKVSIPNLLLQLGEDLDREGLQETPDRVARAWKEFLSGYTMDASEILDKTFDAEGSGLQICKDIEFTSLCEHHLLAFLGTVTIAYVPDGRVCGLSKLARLVECYGRRLQIQERMTQQIADAIQEHLKPKGVFVKVQAKHLCCVGRGVKQGTMDFVTSAMHGKIDLNQYNTMLMKGI